jgi:hypothetical protein
MSRLSIQTSREIIWIIILIITSCIWIVKRLYFDYKLKNMLTGDAFTDVLIYTVVVFLFVLTFYNINNREIFRIALILLIVCLGIILIKLREFSKEFFNIALVSIVIILILYGIYKVVNITMNAMF